MTCPLPYPDSRSTCPVATSPLAAELVLTIDPVLDLAVVLEEREVPKPAHQDPHGTTVTVEVGRAASEPRPHPCLCAAVRTVLPHGCLTVAVHTTRGDPHNATRALWWTCVKVLSVTGGRG